MKWYRILVSGKINYLAESKNEAIEFAEKSIKDYGQYHNLSIFSITEEELL
tara:strand:+ start:371 stop:523 length:153 start_codon:yes stop_codon:yes gene_type:complete